MSYNKKDKMIKIEQYEQDPNREGHEIKVSVLTKKGPKPPIPPKPKPPKPNGMPLWFKVWSETVYQNQQPQWFKVWSETDFSYLKDDVAILKTDVADLKVRMTNVETDVKSIKTIVEYNVQLSILKTPE